MQDFARRMVGSDTISSEQLQQIREQKEVSVVVDGGGGGGGCFLSRDVHRYFLSGGR